MFPPSCLSNLTSVIFHSVCISPFYHMMFIIGNIASVNFSPACLKNSAKCRSEPFAVLVLRRNMAASTSLLLISRSKTSRCWSVTLFSL